MIPRKLRKFLQTVPVSMDRHSQWDDQLIHTGTVHYGDTQYYVQRCHLGGGYVVVHRLDRPPSDLVHELGHALEDYVEIDHVANPVSQYATTNRTEAFAEAFTAWCRVPDYLHLRQYLDQETDELFNRLAKVGV